MSIPFILHKRPSRKTLFVSDIHGQQPKLEAQLNKLADSKRPPKTVIFLGDIAGTEPLMKLQPIFYNLIVNPMKKLLEQNPHPTDNEILCYPTGQDNLRIVDGCKQLWHVLNSIDPSYNAGYCPNIVRDLITFENYDHWVSNLPKSIRNFLKKDLSANAERIYQIMEKFTNRGSLVVIIEGNWDARTPLDFVADREKCIPIPPQNRDFYFKKFITDKQNRNIIYVDHLHYLQIYEGVQMVLMSFDAVMKYDGYPIWKREDIEKTILLTHTQISWEAIKGNTPMTGEGQKIEKNIQKILQNLKPNACVHGHLHDCIGRYQGYAFTNGTFIHYLPIGTCRFIDF